MGRLSLTLVPSSPLQGFFHLNSQKDPQEVSRPCSVIQYLLNTSSYVPGIQDTK